ncbi:MAG: hypothetical protein V4581_02900 [Bacteroidota bacterium]
MEYIIYAVFFLLSILGVCWLQFRVFSSKKAEFATKQLCLSNQSEFLSFVNHYFLSSLNSHKNETHLIIEQQFDSLGSVFAALKLNFDTIKMYPKSISVVNDPFVKIDHLLDEGYQNVRLLSTPIYNKDNIGFQLMHDLKNVAHKASELSGMNIFVQGFGLIKDLDFYKRLNVVCEIQQVLYVLLGYAYLKEIKISVTQSIFTHIIIEINDTANSEVKIFEVLSKMRYTNIGVGSKMVVADNNKSIEINIPL